MALHYGETNAGSWVHQAADGTWSVDHTQTADSLWAWNRGQPSWTVGFLHTYPITMFLGVIIAFLSVAYFWRRMKYSWEILQIMVIIIVPSAILGARLWYLMSEGGWDRWYQLSGLSIQGGVMGAMIAVIPFVLSKRHSVDFRTVCGIVIPAVIIGQAIGRWGNFDNHEVYGKIIDGKQLDWLTFIKPQMLIIETDVHGIQSIGYRHPFFFYESMLNLIGYLVILWLLQRKNWVKPGVPAAIYFMWYGVTRFIMEPLRTEVDIMKWGDMPISTFIAGVWVFVGVVFFVWWQGFTKPFDKWFLALFPKATTWKLRLREYEAIYPVKPRRVFFFGEKKETRGKYFIYFGKEVPNKVKLYLPVDNSPKWSKREINKGKRIKR